MRALLACIAIDAPCRSRPGPPAWSASRAMCAPRSRRAPISSRRCTTATRSWCRNPPAVSCVPAPGAFPLDLRQALRAAHRRRRREGLGPRRGPQPGHGAQDCAGASARRPRRCLPAAPRSNRHSSSPRPAARTDWSGWTRGRACAMPDSSASGWVSAPRASRRWNWSTSSARPRCCAFPICQRNPRLDPSMFRFTPPKGVDVLGE